MLFEARPLIPLLLILFAGGCAGPHALRHSRAKYSEAIQVTQNEQLLLNLVRLRYRDTPSFLELGSLATQFNFDESVGLSGTIKENSANFNVLGLSAGLDASERPTASYTPLQGAEFVTKLVAPIEEETIVLLTRSGWKGERVFRIAVQSLNGLPNLRKGSGPTPIRLTQSEINDARMFRYLVRNLEESSESGVVRFNYESVEIPKSAAIPKSALTPQHAVEAAQHGLKIIHPHDEVAIDINKIKSSSPAVASYVDEQLLSNVVARLRREGLPRPIRVKYDPGDTPELSSRPFTVVGDDLLFQGAKAINADNSNQFAVLPCDVINSEEVILAGESQRFVMTWDAENNEQVQNLGLPSLEATDEGRYTLQVEPRSLIGAMYFLSHAIRIPPEHLCAGLAVLTADEFDAPFDWADVTGDLLLVQHSRHKPECAAVAVKYRGYWFYIDDRDHSSKATFVLLMQLFELRAGGGAGTGPVLTLPVGI